MLTAYTYYEPEEQRRIQNEVKDSSFFDREKSIAKAFTEKHCKSVKNIEKCPVCGEKETSVFFTKWEIPYYRCKNCYSIVGGVENEVAAEYESLSELQNFYESDEYQQYGEMTRSTRWEEILDWISFRTYRYMGDNKKKNVVDYGNRWHAFRTMIKESKICGDYQYIGLDRGKRLEKESADIVLAFDYLQRKVEPNLFFREVYETLAPGGLMFLGLKAGSGMDVLLLKEKNRNVFPCEHLLMPSKEGIYSLLSDLGFEVLEYTTPGMFDVNFVSEHVDDISDDESFIKYLFQKDNAGVYAELQRFIQKAGLSSYAQVVVRKN